MQGVLLIDSHPMITAELVLVVLLVAALIVLGLWLVGRIGTTIMKRESSSAGPFCYECGIEALWMANCADGRHLYACNTHRLDAHQKLASECVDLHERDQHEEIERLRLEGGIAAELVGKIAEMVGARPVFASDGLSQQELLAAVKELKERVERLAEERDTFKAAWEASADVAKKAVEDMAAERVERKAAEAKLTSTSVRAEKAEADVAEVARQRDAYRERARCLRSRLRNSERLRATSPSAPSDMSARVRARLENMDCRHNDAASRRVFCATCVDIAIDAEAASEAAPSGWQQRIEAAFREGYDFGQVDRSWHVVDADGAWSKSDAGQNAKDAHGA